MNASLTFIMKKLLWHANATVMNQELALELCNIVFDSCHTIMWK